MHGITDVIAAVSTPPGKGGVAIIRISGDGAFDVVKKSFISVLKGGVRHAVEYTTMKDNEESISDIKNITQKALKFFC